MRPWRVWGIGAILVAAIALSGLALAGKVVPCPHDAPSPPNVPMVPWSADAPIPFSVGPPDIASPCPDGPVYLTFLGGSDLDDGYAIAVNGAGHVVVAGITRSPDFPTTPAAFDTSHNGLGDLFVAAFDSEIGQLVFSTFLGGSQNEMFGGMAIDGDGNVYLAGTAGSVSDFPTTPGAFLSGGERSADAFLAKLDPTGSTLLYSTFLGGSGGDFALGVAVDDLGHAYVTGDTTSEDFPTTPGAYSRTLSRSRDAFVAKLNPAGAGASDLVYSTYLGTQPSSGRTSITLGRAIAVDAGGHAYVTGNTGNDFPTTPGAFRGTWAGRNDAFVTKLNGDGSDLEYSTYLGGSRDDVPFSIALDAEGNAFLTGLTDSTDFPTTPGAFDTTAGGKGDVFVTKLSADGGSLVYSTYLGGTGEETHKCWCRGSYGIIVDEFGAAFVTGLTSSSDFPITTDAFQKAFRGGEEAFLVRLDPTGSGLVYSTFLGGGDSDFGGAVAANVYAGPAGKDGMRPTGSPRGPSPSLVPMSGDVFIVGFAKSPDFPTTPGAYDRTYNGNGDVFVGRLV